MKPKPSEQMSEDAGSQYRFDSLGEAQQATEMVRATWRFLDEHAHVFERGEPSNITGRTESGVPVCTFDEPKERGDGDAVIDALRSVCAHLSDSDGYVAFHAIEAIEAERARHAEEVERLKKFERYAKLVPDYVRGNAELRKREAKQTERIAELEAEAAELREKIEALQSDYDNLAGGDLPGFGVDPKDSSWLSDLLACIDSHGVWPSEEAENAGDYEAAIRHMGEVCRERACMFSETAKVDVRRAIVDFPVGQRFIGYHCRFTVEALYTIGEAAEVSKPEGRDS